MKINLKNWGLKFLQPLKNRLAGWILAAILVFLPPPIQTIPPVLTFPPDLNQINIDLPQVKNYPVNITGILAPGVSAQGAYIIDSDSMVSLYQKNPDIKLRPASTTKIMTALVMLDKFSPTDVITIKDEGVIGKIVKFQAGEQFILSDMLYALLLESGNDAALAIGENYPGGYAEIVKAMNEKARSLGMNGTVYENVSGIDQGQHKTTVHDMAILTAYAMQNQLFAQIVRTSEKKITSLDNKNVHNLKNTNELLEQEKDINGVKTGWTTLARECLITSIEKDGHKIMIALLGSQDRFGETKKLIDWVFNNHSWEKIL